MAQTLSLDEQFNIRKLQPVQGPLAPLSPVHTPDKSRHISTIGKAQGSTDVPQHRPELSSPMWGVLAVQRETERLTDKATTVFEQDVNKFHAERDQLDAEKQEALEKEAQAARSRSTWSVLSIISDYVYSTGLAVIGSSLSSPLLVAAGVIGLGNRVLRDTNLLNTALSWYTKSEEQQKIISKKIDAASMFLQFGLTLAGTVTAWHSGALAAAQINGENAANTVKSVITTAGTILSVGSRVGTSYYDKQMAYLQARMREIDTQNTLTNLNARDETKEVVRMVETTGTQAEEMSKMIRAQTVEID